MNYLKELSLARQISLAVLVVFAVAIVVIFNMPYQATLTSEAKHFELPDDVTINMPCTQANLTSGEKTIITTHITGKGYATFSYLLDNQDINNQSLMLRIFGFVRHVSCTVDIELGRNSTVYLPSTMPFIARSGVHPAPTAAGNLRKFEPYLMDN